MESKITLAKTIETLESYFSKLNERFFENELSKPVIAVSPDTARGAYGWCTSWKAWKDSDSKAENDEDGYYEINICCEYLNRPISETCETLLHEMVHLYNIQNDIQDCSRGGTYHNKLFRDAAIAHGLDVEYEKKYGWTKTSLNAESTEYVNSIADSTFNLSRTKIESSTKQNSSSRKYVCPKCGLIIRATRDVNVICGECNVPLRLEAK